MSVTLEYRSTSVANVYRTGYDHVELNEDSIDDLIREYGIDFTERDLSRFLDEKRYEWSLCDCEEEDDWETIESDIEVSDNEIEDKMEAIRDNYKHRYDEEEYKHRYDEEEQEEDEPEKEVMPWEN
jgi:DNA-directed RNA polymerase specialized sigma subunit